MCVWGEGLAAGAGSLLVTWQRGVWCMLGLVLHLFHFFPFDSVEDPSLGSEMIPSTFRVSLPVSIKHLGESNTQRLVSRDSQSR